MKWGRQNVRKRMWQKNALKMRPQRKLEKEKEGSREKSGRWERRKIIINLRDFCLLKSTFEQDSPVITTLMMNSRWKDRRHIFLIIHSFRCSSCCWDRVAQQAPSASDATVADEDGEGCCTCCCCCLAAGGVGILSLSIVCWSAAAASASATASETKRRRRCHRRQKYMGVADICSGAYK